MEKVTISDFFDQKLADILKKEQQRLTEQRQWLTKWQQVIPELPSLPQDLWVDEQIVVPLEPIPVRFVKIGAVDGGLITEELRGFDLVISRAVSPVFSGIGENVDVKYYPNFDPSPNVFLTPSLNSRHDLNRLATLLRLRDEYLAAYHSIKVYGPKIFFIDGSVHPHSTDFQNPNQTKLISQMIDEVKSVYNRLVMYAFESETLLIGVIKDTRSRDFSKNLVETIVQWIRAKSIDTVLIKGYRAIMTNILDSELATLILKNSSRTAWYRSSAPSWVPSHPPVEVWVSLIKLNEDTAIKTELLAYPERNWFQELLPIMLSVLYVTTQHGLGVALPSFIIESDERAKLSGEYLDEILNQISVTFGVNLEYLRKRRYFPF